MVPAIAEPSRPAREMPDSSLEVRSERSGLRRLAVSGWTSARRTMGILGSGCRPASGTP
jgi:hypothetical protein